MSGMVTFEAAVADYLDRTGHARPWTRRQEADALDGLGGWLRAAADGVPLAAVTPQVVSAYAADRGLSAEEMDDLRGTVAGLRTWARAVAAAE